ncbi:MAG TPA: nitroreductase/quinone reductase family protein [Acidimicrobiia bacterium]|nr:nitroreductase/quinone reductase family protein [Acidimicrobiia bacterium]
MELGADAAFCYLTTRGRVTGRAHEIEIWFARVADTFYLLAGGGERSDWVRNLRADPAVTIRVGDVTSTARGRVLGPGAEDALARRRVFDKYQPGYQGDLRGWRDRALAVAVDVQS